MPLASAAGRTDLDRRLDDDRQVDGCTSSRSLPEMMRETSSRSSMSWACERALRSIDLEPARDASRSIGVPSRRSCVQPRMALSGVRSSWETRGEELVLHAVGALGLGARRPLALEQPARARRPAAGLGDVHARHGKADHFVGFVPQRLDGHVVRSALAIGLQPDFLAHALIRVEHAALEVGQLPRIVIERKLVIAPSEQHSCIEIHRCAVNPAVA